MKVAPSARTETNWKLISQQLREDPGVWYLLAIGGHGLMQHNRIVKGRTGNWWPAGSYEATIRSIDGQTRLYGRYVGTPDEQVERPGPSVVDDPALITAAEFAQMIDVTVTRAYSIASRSDFPPPHEASSASRYVWDRELVEKFLETWDRRPGRRSRRAD